jgi:hypothetical protein
MSLTITSTGVVFLCGLAWLGWIAGNVGSLLSIIQAAILTDSVDSGRIYVSLLMSLRTLKLQAIKIPLAFLVAGVSMELFPSTQTTVTMTVCAVLGYVVQVLMGTPKV